VHLPYFRSADPKAQHLDRHSLREVAGKDNEIVFYFRDRQVNSASWEAAKALAWGYDKVHRFLGGARAWAAAGFPVETGD
jgi:rhodanese-related sulfurtransferase